VEWVAVGGGIAGGRHGICWSHGEYLPAWAFLSFQGEL
jgi:hypothetical protein